MGEILKFPWPDNQQLKDAINFIEKGASENAIKLLENLAGNGNDKALCYLGMIYDYGLKDIEVDYTKAKKYYEQTIEKIGFVEAYLGLIKIHFYGLGTNIDYSQAYEYCKILIEDTNDMYALFFVGKMKFEGKGFDKNIEKANEYFRKSWNEGYIYALTYLGLIEQYNGKYIRGAITRFRAGFKAYTIALQNIEDPRIREFGY